jgi:nucleotide-binding universal stress UspA family protein
MRLNADGRRTVPIYRDGMVNGGRAAPLFANALVGVDELAGGRAALVLARRLAGDGARIRLVHVYREPGGGEVPQGLTGREMDLEHRVFHTADGRFVVCEGRPGAALRELACREGADLLVLGSSRHGRGGRMRLGDDVVQALDGAGCAVAVAPRDYGVGVPAFRSIGVGDPGGPEAPHALALARALADRHRASLVVRSVAAGAAVTQDEALQWIEESRLAASADRSRAADGELVEGAVASGSAPGELAALAEQVDLLVAGSGGLGRACRMPDGSQAGSTRRGPACPLLVAAPAPSGPAPADAAPAHGLRLV